MNNLNDTICAIATPYGYGAIAIIRISGENAFNITDKIFISKNNSKNIININGNSLTYGEIIENSQVIDQVLISKFISPYSYTGENSIEISCHGSVYIQQKILELLINNGCRIAKPGEFTLRAFYNNKLDLSQAEAVADLISSNSENSHKVAMNQLRGGFSNDIKKLRTQLLDFASLIELELDFSEEDVEFANRNDLKDLINTINIEVDKLLISFKYGNSIKNGIPVAIIGKPNVGKSTLMNAILNDEKSIVSEIPGTTRDSIEDLFNIEGQLFRFIDTAGLREANDEIEKIGISRTYEKINQAEIILYVVDIINESVDEIKSSIIELKSKVSDDKKIILIANKIDQLVEVPQGGKKLFDWETIFISAKRKENIQMIKDTLLSCIDSKINNNETILSNYRHYDSLNKVKLSLDNILSGLDSNLTNDLISLDVKQAIYYLGEITGEISTDEILGNIFSKFCIGK